MKRWQIFLLCLIVFSSGLWIGYFSGQYSILEPQIAWLESIHERDTKNLEGYVKVLESIDGKLGGLQ